jgi:hypothetical protein
MPDLDFEIIAADVKPYAAVPTILFKLKITNTMEGEEVYAVGLRSQLRIEAMHRTYEDKTKERLLEVFGKPERWGQTLKSLFWKQITVPVPQFIGETIINIPLECGEDMSTAVGKYMYAIEEGPVPLNFFFNGSIFYKGPEEALQVTQLPWDKEATYSMPVSLWDKLLDVYFPDSKWLRVPKDTFDKLYIYKANSTYPTLNRCLEALVDGALEKNGLPQNYGNTKQE